MRNNTYSFFLSFFFLLCLSPIFGLDKTPSPLTDSIPYAKYVPLELLMEIYNIQDAITYLETEDPDLASQLQEVLENKKNASRIFAVQRIAERLKEVEEEINEMNRLSPIDPRLKGLEREYAYFKAAFDTNVIPDDGCLNEIDQLYRELVIWNSLIVSPHDAPEIRPVPPILKTTMSRVTIDDHHMSRPGNAPEAVILHNFMYNDGQEEKSVYEITKEVFPNSNVSLHMRLRIPPKSYSYYTVMKGDTLAKIARYFYNDSRKWKLIYETNQNLFPSQENSSLIYPGMRLRIPLLSTKQF